MRAQAVTCDDDVEDEGSTGLRHQVRMCWKPPLICGRAGVAADGLQEPAMAYHVGSVLITQRDEESSDSGVSSGRDFAHLEVPVDYS